MAGTDLKGVLILESYFASVVPSLADASLERSSVLEAGVVLLDRIGFIMLVGQSQGAMHGCQIADARPDPVKEILASEPPFESVSSKRS